MHWPHAWPRSSVSLRTSRAFHGPLSPAHFYDATVEEFARREPQLVRIGALLNWHGTQATGQRSRGAQLVRSAEWLRQELPVRLARTLRNFQNQPYIMARNLHIHELYERSWYSFTALRQVAPITDEAAEQQFADLLKRLLARSEDSLAPLARGVAEVQPLSSSLGLDPTYLATFVDRFLMQRLSRRILAGFHLALHTPKPGWVGVFHLETSPAECIAAVAGEVQQMAQQQYGHVPLVSIDGDTACQFASCPFILECVLAEVLKNAYRAALERRESRPAHWQPQVEVQVCDGEAVTVIVRDNGGGLQGPRPLTGVSGDNTKTELSRNWAMGLPQSYVFTRYLGGDLRVMSMEGYGTSVYITMPRLDTAVAKEGRTALHMNRQVWECGT
eukprot:GGOE01040730.1.p1 GENE.GGOE01040730.1~~GGOE01040730.1.p1  ORF type:complete len:388 (-),score=57.94 GGOE01040730.1:16-1179(-)